MILILTFYGKVSIVIKVPLYHDIPMAPMVTGQHHGLFLFGLVLTLIQACSFSSQFLSFISFII